MDHHIEATKTHQRNAEPRARLRSLLILLDLTPLSDRILLRVSQLPLAHDALVTLLHVVADPPPHPYRADAERYARQALAEEARALAKSLPRSVRIDPVVKAGAVVQEAVAFARTRGAELIVVGRGDRRAALDFFLGSTAERLARRAKTPALVVRAPARRAYQRPALALDLGHPAQNVVSLTLRVLGPSHPCVPVIHAFMPPCAYLSPFSLLHERVARQRDASDKLSALLAASLEDARIAPGHAPAWKLLVRYGSARRVVAKLAEQLQTDLLALGTRSYTGVTRALLGTVAGELLRDVKCDVLLVPNTSPR